MIGIWKTYYVKKIFDLKLVVYIIVLAKLSQHETFYGATIFYENVHVIKSFKQMMDYKITSLTFQIRLNIEIFMRFHIKIV